MQTDKPRSFYIKLIDEWIFNEDDRDMLKRRLLDGLTFEQLGYEFDLSVRQIKRRVAKAQKTLFRHMQDLI